MARERFWRAGHAVGGVGQSPGVSAIFWSISCLLIQFLIISYSLVSSNYLFRAPILEPLGTACGATTVSSNLT